MRKRLPQALASDKLGLLESSCQVFLRSRVGCWLMAFDQRTWKPSGNHGRRRSMRCSGTSGVAEEPPAAAATKECALRIEAVD
jgi:hypothetical protein